MGKTAETNSGVLLYSGVASVEREQQARSCALQSENLLRVGLR